MFHSVIAGAIALSGSAAISCNIQLVVKEIAASLRSLQ
jgi:hypothetical protein